MKDKNNIIQKIRAHFLNNPFKLYSIVYFSKKWDRKYKTVYCYLEKLHREGFVLKFYFSANQGLFAWGIPKPIFAVYVLNPFLHKKSSINKLTLKKNMCM